MLEAYRILLVEDDENLGLVVSDLLEMGGHAVQWSRDGEVALRDFNTFGPHLCLVDVMLPKKDGYSLVEDIKRLRPDMPVIFLTARSMEDDRIRGFRSGADDYVTKPFSNQELMLRISAVLQRCYASGAAEASATFRIGSYVFDPVNLLLKGTEERSLTQKEADILSLLCRQQDTAVHRDLILKTVWGQSDYFVGRSLDVFISKLRKYLKDDPTVNIETIHGVGFRLRVG
ncbi:MAG: response regulator transcription factor [Flavobacteriales bacterium]|nr:response regulator transcription factor [Flavobacteriales bacterium]